MALQIDRRLLALLALVLAVHLMSFWTEIKNSIQTAYTPVISEPTEVKVIPMTDEEWSKFKAKNQIVQNDDTGKHEKPKDTAFLGEKDMSYDRQTVARKIDTFNKAAKGNSAIDSLDSKPQKTQAKKKAIKDLKLSDIGVSAVGAPQIQRAPASFAKKGLANGDEKSQGLSSTNDYIEHVSLGDFTQLNTVEYKYYGFFNRIRGKLEQYWGRTLREKADAIYKSGRSIASEDQYTTALLITMNEKGEIVGVKVKSSSGVRELDDAAIESFNQAGPFPNPPSGMLVNGRATIEWGFVVKS
ncbi:MAG: energy transducer TonB [Bacteriovoracaceae bacterium]|nr:energy transducer TonB [Bacteriovoracaceae bacterium]